MDRQAEEAARATEPPPPEAGAMPSRWRGRWARGLCWVLVAAMFTWVLVDFSQRRGRLIAPPDFDDVVYMSDGMRRLRLFEQGGTWALLRDYAAVETHAPLSSALAFFGFLLLGPHDWAPYAMNGLLALGLLLGVDALMRGRPFEQKLAAGLFALSVPLTGQAICEFRPDIACGLVTAAGVCILFADDWVAASWKRHAAGGAVMGLALVCKPTTSLMTAALLGVSLVAVAARDRMLDSYRWQARRAFVATLRALAAAALVSLPYFAVNAGHVLAYIHMVFFQDLPARGGVQPPLLEQANYYLGGFGGRRMLGWHLVLWGVVGIGALVCAVKFKRTRDAQRAAAFAVPVVFTYGVVSFVGVRNHFFGLAFHGLLLASVLMTVRWLWLLHESRGGQRWQRRVALVVLVGLGFLASHFPPRLGRPSYPEIQSRNVAARQVHDALREARADERVALTFTGYVNTTLLGYMDLKEGRPARTYEDGGLSADPGTFGPMLDRAVWVVASEAGNENLLASMPSTRIAGETLALVRARSEFELVSEIALPSGKRFFVFRRKAGSKPEDANR
ncbi:MAG: glycosyltransferase family 39 protein [Planctomycetota bacterium]|nr:glycosyltransferase family 39 protein [Planctomycetota bacterium]